MGKKGRALREAKAANVTYTFTQAQLLEHDIAVRMAYKKDIMNRVKADADEMDRKRTDEFNAKIHELWDERERKFKTGYLQGDALAMACAMLNITVAVLVEDFRWVPVRNGHRTRLQRFCEGVTERMNKIASDEREDIIRYAESVEKRYGVTFMMEDAE